MAYSNSILLSALKAGIDQIREAKSHLNQINRFPVADNDTGTNMLLSAQALVRNLSAKSATFFDDLADNAVIGARGNSGSILAQFIVGLAAGDALRNGNLRDAVRQGTERAYASMRNPREGTMLTIMRAWADALGEGHSHEVVTQKLNAAVKKTTQQLAELRKSGVVDSGAQGFALFAQAFSAVLERADLGHGYDPAQAVPETESARGIAADVNAGLAAEDEAEPLAEDDLSEYDPNSLPEHRYCTNLVFRGGDSTPVQETLATLGDSLVVASSPRFTRAHVHTSSPRAAVQAVDADLVSIDVEDMWFQVRTRTEREGTALVIDSIADLPREIIDSYDAVYELPIRVVVDGVVHQDKRTVSAADLAGRDASSSQLNLAEVSHVLDAVTRAHRDVIVLTVSSQMSGTHERVIEYARDRGNRATQQDGVLHTTWQTPEEHSLTVIDSRLNSGAEGLLAKRAIELLREGATAAQVTAEVVELRARTRIFVSVASLEAMANSGRIPQRLGALLVRLGMRPLVTIDAAGKGSITGVSLSQEGSERVLSRRLRRMRIEESAVVFSEGAEMRANWLRAVLERHTRRGVAFTTEISAVTSLFAGAGAVAACVVLDPVAQSR